MNPSLLDTARRYSESHADELGIATTEIPGLYAAGDAMGGLMGGYRGGYTGGLMQAVVTGILAGENASVL